MLDFDNKVKLSVLLPVIINAHVKCVLIYPIVDRVYSLVSIASKSHIEFPPGCGLE